VSIEKPAVYEALLLTLPGSGGGHPGNVPLQHKCCVHVNAVWMLGTAWTNDAPIRKKQQRSAISCVMRVVLQILC
jgi:hypothetical protein